MNKGATKRKMYNKVRQKTGKKMPDEEVKVDYKLIITLSFILVVLLMKRYDYSIGFLNTEYIYEQLYDSESFNEIVRVFMGG